MSALPPPGVSGAAPGDAERRDDFFVGYLGRAPAASRALLLAVGVGLLGGFAIGGWAIGVSQASPPPSGWAGRVTLQGVLRAEPYPYLQTPPSADFPKGRAIPLNSTRGKYGLQAEAGALDGAAVEISGPTLKRGDATTLLAPWNGREGRHAVTPLDGAAAAAAASGLATAEDLGRWRLTGEICDGKCVVGVMNPGAGLAHKACANMCLIGGVPALFVTQGPMPGVSPEGAGPEHSEFLLIADLDGGTPGPELLDRVAELVSLEGRVERVADLLIFKADLSTIAAPAFAEAAR